MRVASPFSLRAVVPVAVLLAAACFYVRKVEIKPVDVASGDSAVVASPARAHLVDGSTIVYRNGATILRDTVRGDGSRFTLTLAAAGSVSVMPLDSVLGMESYKTVFDSERSVKYSVYTVAGIAAVAGIIVAAACAADPKCFGSCPTFYSDSAGVPVLEAEGFSYSVAPLLEARDIDRLRTGADAGGKVRLQVRNEAMETQYMNHLELLEVTHSAGEYVVPDERGRPLAVRNVETPSRMHDRQGANVRRILADHDGQVYRTSAHTLAAVRLDDMTDHIDVAVPRPAGADSIVMLFRMRNSLLNTVLFYDFMLGRPGARSIDWISQNLDSLANVIDLGRWYAERFGLRISVLDSGSYRQVARVSDQGPVAWRDVGLVIPVPASENDQDSLEIRISFVADEWRIDRVAMATSWRRAASRMIPLTTVTRLDGTPVSAALGAMGEADDRYLETTMGQAFVASFDVGAVPAGVTRTFMLASQGYYSEWVRREWIRSSRDAATFVPSDATLLAVLKEWRAVQDDMERRFYATRIPVR